MQEKLLSLLKSWLKVMHQLKKNILSKLKPLKLQKKLKKTSTTLLTRTTLSKESKIKTN